VSRLFDVDVCPFSEVKDFIVQNHYSHSAARPGIISHCFAARIEGLLVGAAIFGHTAGNAETGAVLLPPYNGKDYNRELLKLVMIDVMPKNSESKFIGVCRRYLKGYSTILGLLSYADPEHGHGGTIYRGDNWFYTGTQESASRKLVINGDECHGKKATEKYKTASVRKLKAMGHTVEVRKANPKHRYVYLLHPGLERFMKYKIVARAQVEAGS
jgi:hypothetical protein